MTTKPRRTCEMHNVMKHREDGFVLVSALIFLVVLTILGLTSMQVASLEEKMAGGARDRSIAFQAAETTLRYGEVKLLGVVPEEFTDTCDDAKCSNGALPDATNPSAWAAAANKIGVPRSASDSLLNPSLAADPSYMLEYAGQYKANTGQHGGAAFAYRGSVRANGINGTTVVTLQEVFSPPP